MRGRPLLGRPRVVTEDRSTLMNTTEVAEHLGLGSAVAARRWLRRHRIHAVGREGGAAGQSLYPAELVHRCRSRLGSPPRPPYDRWRDATGAHVPTRCRVEQVEIDARLGAPRSRLGKQGQVIGRGSTRLVVQFDEESDAIRIRPHLVRRLEIDQPLSTAHIITQLWDLLPAIGEAHER